MTRRNLAKSLSTEVAAVRGREMPVCDGMETETDEAAAADTGAEGFADRDCVKPNRRISMRIAIPLVDKATDAQVCTSFGRAPYFLLCNTVTKESYVLNNSLVACMSGAGIKTAKFIADYGVDALLVLRCGDNAMDVLRKAGVLVYKMIPGTAQQNIEAFNNERLVLLSDFSPEISWS